MPHLFRIKLPQSLSFQRLILGAISRTGSKGHRFPPFKLGAPSLDGAEIFDTQRLSVVAGKKQLKKGKRGKL